MAEPVEFIRSKDMLLRDVGAEYTLELPVLGLETRFESNSTTVLEHVEAAFGDWRMLQAHTELITESGARVRFIVHDRPVPAAGSFEYFVMSDARVLISGGQAGICDPVRRESIVYVRPSQLEHWQQFRYSILEAAVFSILTHLDRPPVHAAAVTRNGRAVLLAAASGTGKSTLTYALAQAGFSILTEDSVYLQTEGKMRVWGMPRFLHLSEEARRFFPELALAKAELMVNGKAKIAIDARAAGFTAVLPVADDPLICLLTRGGQPGIERISAAEVERAFSENQESGFDLFAPSAAIRRLAERGGWRLTLGESPHDAVPLVERILAGA